MPSASLLAQGVALGVLTGGVYALLASGLTLYFGVMRVVQIAHPAFLFLAAYLTYVAFTAFGIDPLLSMVVTVPVFFVLGFAI
jgi:branched-chain amino acid transport system permease protein